MPTIKGLKLQIVFDGKEGRVWGNQPVALGFIGSVGTTCMLILRVD